MKRFDINDPPIPKFIELLISKDQTPTTSANANDEVEPYPGYQREGDSIIKKERKSVNH